MFVENKTKVASRVGCSERAVLYRELLFKSNKKKFSFRRVESEKIGIRIEGKRKKGKRKKGKWKKRKPKNGKPKCNRKKGKRKIGKLACNSIIIQWRKGPRRGGEGAAIPLDPH